MPSHPSIPPKPPKGEGFEVHSGRAANKGLSDLRKTYPTPPSPTSTQR